MALLPNGGRRLTHLKVPFFPPHTCYLLSRKCHQEDFGRQPFSFALTSCRLPLFPFFILPSLFPSLPHCSYLSSSLIVPSCIKLSVACSLGNWLTFALGYCSHLLPLKYLNRQNPTLHLRHGQISPTTISQCPEYITMRSAFMYLFNLFFPHSRVVVTCNKQQSCAYVTMASVHAFVEMSMWLFISFT